MKTTYSMTGIVLVAVSGLLAACGEATPEPTQPAVTASAAVTAAPTVTAVSTTTPTAAAVAPAPLPDLGLKLGHLDSKILTQALSAKGAEKFKIRTNAAGDVTKLSLYHNDASLIPEAVQATLKKKLPGATVKSYESEFYSDKGRVFEIEVTTKDKKSCELGALADGKFVYTECDIKADKLPKPVTAAITKLLPGGEIIEAEESKGDINEFSAEVKMAGVMHYLSISPKGDVTRHGRIVPTYLDLTFTAGAAVPAGDANPGHIDPELLSLALKAKGTQKIKLRTNAGNDLIKIALYHQDETAIPDASKATATAKYPGSKGTSYFESEVYSDHGKVFEVDLTTADNKKCEVSSLKDGTFVYTECDIKKEELPKEISDALAKLAPGGEIVEAEKKESPWGNGYTAEVKAGGLLHYIKLSATGEVVWHGVRFNTELDVAVP